MKLNKNYNAIQSECDEYGSSKDTYANTPIKDVYYTFTMLLFFREISDTTNPIPMEVEEGGIESYMVDFQGMLDGLDNPSEVNGVGVGTCAGENQVERESNAMGRDGGAKDGEVKPLPVSKDSILTCPEPRSDDKSFEGVKSSLPRD